MKVNEIPIKQNANQVTDPKTQVSAEEFNALVDNAKESVTSMEVLAGQEEVKLSYGKGNGTTPTLTFPNATAAGAGMMSPKQAARIGDRTATDGMGYVVLDKGKTFAEQVTHENTIYEIRYDFDLGGQTKEIPAGCVLKFEGGSLRNGSIGIDSAHLVSAPVQIFHNISFAGVVEHFSGLPEWFGAVGDGNADDTAAIQKCVDSFTTTELTGKSYLITTVLVDEVRHAFGRHIVNHGDIISTGIGFALNAHCSFTGGHITIRKGASGITIGREDDKESHNRISVTKTQMLSLSTIGTYGINCIARQGNHYNAFCHIEDVKIYGCEHGFYGNIRSSYINVELEGCLDAFRGTNCSLNTIILTGNANETTEDYPCFITINGDLNTIIPNVYDVGSSGWHEKMIDINGYGNKVLNCPNTIYNTDVTNTASAPYFVNGMLAYKCPYYNVIYNNVNNNDSLKNIFDESTRTQSRLYLTDSSKEGYVEFQFGRVFGFIGVEFLHSHPNVSFTKIEVRRDSTDETPFLTITNKGYSTHTSVFSNTYKDFYNYVDSTFAPHWNENLSVRCYIRNGTHLVGARFYAHEATDRAVSYGPLEDKPSTMKAGEQYFATDVKEDDSKAGTLLTYNGDEMVSANGEKLGRLQKVFKRLQVDPGTYQFAKLEFTPGNPINVVMPIKFCNVSASLYYTEFVLSICGTPANPLIKISKITTDTYTLKCHVYTKTEGGKMSCIIAFTKIDGVWGYLNIDRVLTNQEEYTLKGITSNEDVSEFTDNVFSLYDMAMDTGTRLGYKDERKGRYVFDTGKNKPFWWDGDEWVDALGLNDSTFASGPFAYRPSSSKIQVGHSYFCTDKKTAEGDSNGIMIYYKGEDVWVDALGRAVEQ